MIFRKYDAIVADDNSSGACVKIEDLDKLFNQDIRIYTSPIFGFYEHFEKLPIDKTFIRSPIFLKSERASINILISLLKRLKIKPILGGYRPYTEEDRFLFKVKRISLIDENSIPLDQLHKDFVVYKLIQELKFFTGVDIKYLLIILAEIHDPRWFIESEVNPLQLYQHFGLSNYLDTSPSVERNQRILRLAVLNDQYIKKLTDFVNAIIYEGRSSEKIERLYQFGKNLFYRIWYEEYSRNNKSPIVATFTVLRKFLDLIFYRWLSLIYKNSEREFFILEDFFKRDEDKVQFQQWLSTLES